MGSSSLTIASKKDAVLKPKQARTPAWFDNTDITFTVPITDNRKKKLRIDEDEKFIRADTYQKRLRTQFEKSNPPASWAQLPHQKQNAADSDSDSDSDPFDDVDFLQSSKSVTAKKSSLSKNVFNVTRLKNANSANPSNSVIQSVDFHPSGEIILTAGFDKTLKLFQVDGIMNTQITRHFIQSFPIHQASFFPDGSSILITGRRRYFYRYDLFSNQMIRIPEVRGRPETTWKKFTISPKNDLYAFIGNNGYVVFVDNKSNQAIATLRSPHQVTDMQFSKNNTLSTFGVDGSMLIWDVGTRRCISKWNDHGCIQGTSMALSPDDQYYATGSSSGVVNLYPATSVKNNKNPVPSKEFMNIKTRIDYLQFTHDHRILIAASRSKENALKVFHVPSKSCYSNWPRYTLNFGNISALAISPDSAYLAFGNSEGKAFLHRLNDYVN